MKELVVFVSVVVCVLLAFTLSIKFSSKKENNNKNITDNDIMVFLKCENIINEKDTDKRTYSEVGNFGTEDKEYI